MQPETPVPIDVQHTGQECGENMSAFHYLAGPCEGISLHREGTSVSITFRSEEESRKFGWLLRDFIYSQFQAHSTTKSNLQYRPNEFDDWGIIRNMDGSVFASIRRPLTEEDRAQHRLNGSDPYEDLALRLMEAML